LYLKLQFIERHAREYYQARPGVQDYRLSNKPRQGHIYLRVESRRSAGVLGHNLLFKLTLVLGNAKEQIIGYTKRSFQTQ
jgi:hypothetical protein